MNSPVKQISESQRVAPKLQVEPEAKVMQGHFRSQACLKAIQRMRTLTSQPKGIEQLAIDGLNDLTQSSQPASPGFGPMHLTALMRGADHLSMILLMPVPMQQITCEAFVSHIDALCWRTNTGQTRRRLLASGEKGLGQRMVVATACGKAKAGNHASWRNGSQQMEALIPANAVAPADIGLSRQPAGATPLGIARGNARTVQGFIQAALCLQVLNQVQTEGHDDIALLPLQPIELLALRQRRKRWAQVAHRIAVEGAFTGKLRPLAKHGQRHYLATRQRRRWSRTMFLSKAGRLAKIIDQHVPCSQKGILVHHQRAPFPYELDRQAHCRLWMPFFQVLSISHQTFKKKRSTMTIFRNRKFLEGIAVGGIGGMIIGSILAFLIGESRIQSARRMIENRLPKHNRIPFEYLSQ